ncbi:MAG: RagB/SusD family nutrient uptake outer membrane protein [Niabella sp.]|nr:RagB/SusD family nutrient uptake outer membrane protein [Niabella sp.]
MNNKIFKGLCVGLVGMIALNSCTKLDVKTYSVVGSNSFWQTPDQITAGVAPAYGGFSSIASVNSNIATMLECTADDIVVPTRGNDWGDAGHWDALWKHTYEKTNDNWNSGWKDIFNAISSCNNIISSVNGIKPAPPSLAVILAQVKTLRAYYYFMAMDVFGNIPIVTDTTLSTTSPTKARADVFNFIISEVQSSLPYLTTTVDPSTYGKVTKYFAFALLARMYLNAQVLSGKPGLSYTAGTPAWQKASDYCDSILLSNKYSLMSNYFDNFAPTNGPSSTENIFAVVADHINNPVNSWENAILHYQSYQAFGMSTGANLWNGFCSAADFYNNFDTTSSYALSGSNTLRTYKDMRSGQWLVGQQFKGTYNYPPSQNVIAAGPSANQILDAQTGFPLAFNPNFTQFSDASAQGRLAGVRNIKYFPSPNSGKGGSDMDNDMIVFRLAEILLIKAEAQLRLGNPGAALPLVNQLRTRAYGGNSSFNLTSIDLPTLLAEKGREMAYEGVRRDDLIRYEVAGNGDYFTRARVPGKAKDPDQHTMVFPIPAQQMTANSGLVQNPGY